MAQLTIRIPESLLRDLEARGYSIWTVRQFLAELFERGLIRTSADDLAYWIDRWLKRR